MAPLVRFRKCKITNKNSAKKAFPATFRTSRKSWEKVGKSWENDGKMGKPFGSFLGKLEFGADASSEDGSEQERYLVADGALGSKGRVQV